MLPNLHFELRLEERQADRVFVSAVLAPVGPEPGAVEGVSVQMVDRAGDALGARMVLPLSGEVHQPLLTTVEIRSRGPIPPGARVMAVAWAGSDQAEASCPCDPGTQLQVHMLGQRVISMGSEPHGMRSLEGEEREVLGRLMPWVNAPRADSAPGVVEERETTSEEMVEEVAEQYDLDDDDAAFLKELLEGD